ncbi:MAG TPA: DUF5916 domain-containing protein [Kofleriaceae bacterium]|nr:DUF5916 domain-containing protein [Kofleriaceae bacterium]
MLPRLPCLLAVAALCLSRPARADEATNPLFAPRSVTAARTHAAIHVDGQLDEPAWATAAPGDRFIQQGPKPGEAATLRTEFRVLFDDDALYIGVRLDDPAAHAIEAPLGRRDDENTSDWCFVEIDSRRDRRTAFSFGVNPAGLQVDGVFIDDTSYDSSWNAVWEAAAHVDATGWTAEYRIPFSVLAFHTPSPGTPMRWGINVYRSNPHSGEVANWSPRVPQLAGVVSLFNELVIDGAPSPRRIELTPYALLQADHAGAPAPRGGLDANLGLTPSLGLAATILPDFGQVEADPTQLNLTTFELFQQERRPFFTEGIDAFRFDTSLALVSRDDSFAEEAAFYSRRIGRAPEGDVPGDATAPLATDILGAAKLFGQTASGWRTGVLAAATRGADATAADGTTTPVAAASEAVIARAVREADHGNRELGVFASALHRQVDGALADQLTRDAVTAGGDARIRWDDQTYEARAWSLVTDQRGSAAAIARLASEPWHNLDRVDAPRLHLAPGATQLAGVAADARLAKVGGDLLWSVAARAISPGFDVNSLGFQRNTDWLLAAGQWSYLQFPTSAWLRSWQVGSDNLGVGWSWGGERRAAVADAYVKLDFTNYWDATLTAQHEFAVRSTEWLRGGPALALPRREDVKISIHSDTRRTTFAGLDASLTHEPGSGSYALAAEPSLTLRVSDHLAGILGATLEDQVVGWQLVAAPAPPPHTDVGARGDLPVAPDGTYLVGRLHQRTVALSLQTDIAISPRFIIQLYAQPFTTVGRFGRFAVLTDPGAGRFAVLGPGEIRTDATQLHVMRGAAFSVPRPDTSQRTLIASAVARWEWSPGSFVTAVWSHRGDHQIATTTARLAAELGDVLAEPGDDIVLVKLDWRFAL